MSLKDDYILMILSCEKYEKERRVGQINQFLNNNSIMQGIRYFHLVGDKDKFRKNKKLKYIVDEEKNIIYTNTLDDYLSLAHKTISGLKALYETFDFKYVLKTDDDQRLINPNIFSILDTVLKNKKPDYFGKLCNMEEQVEKWQPIVHKNDGFPTGYIVGDGKPFGNGRFYGLSRRNVEDLVKNKYDLVKKEYSEDWSIAKNQKLEYRMNNMYLDNSKIFADFEVYNYKNEQFRRQNAMNNINMKF